MRRLSPRWVPAVAAALFIPALLVASGANAAGKPNACLDSVAGRAQFVDESIGGFRYADAGTPVLEDATTYEVTWNRTGLEVEIFLAAGCTAAEAGDYRVTLAYPDGRTITSTATSVINDATGAATKVEFAVPQLETVSDNAGKVESRGQADRVFIHVETLNDRGTVVDRGPDAGGNEICVTYQSTDATGPCYHPDGGGSGYWN